MLKSRLLTALILIPLVIAGIFLLPPLSFFSVAMAVILLAGWEWTQLAGIYTLQKKIIFLVLLGCALVLTVFIPLYIIILLGVSWWLFALVLLAIYPRGVAWWAGDNLVRAAMAFFVLVPCWIGLIILQGFCPALLFYCLILIWGVDSAAYFVGRKWGSHKLAPSISPGKSYEGMLGGLLAAAIISGIGSYLLDIPKEKAALFIVICLVGGGLVTVAGDLFESMLKRQSHLKDSGSLLPGHGGVLDRIDSMTTAIPFFALIFPFFFNS